MKIHLSPASLVHKPNAMQTACTAFSWSKDMICIQDETSWIVPSCLNSIWPLDQKICVLFPNRPLWLNHSKKTYPTLTSPVPSPHAQVNVLEPCLLVWGGGCKVEIIRKNVKVCAPFIKIREGCFESPKFLLKAPCNLHTFFAWAIWQHLSTSSLRQLLKKEIQDKNLSNLIDHKFFSSPRHKSMRLLQHLIAGQAYLFQRTYIYEIIFSRLQYYNLCLYIDKVSKRFKKGSAKPKTSPCNLLYNMEPTNYEIWCFFRVVNRSLWQNQIPLALVNVPNG